MGDQNPWPSIEIQSAKVTYSETTSRFDHATSQGWPPTMGTKTQQEGFRGDFVAVSDHKVRSNVVQGAEHVCKCSTYTQLMCKGNTYPHQYDHRPHRAQNQRLDADRLDARQFRPCWYVRDGLRGSVRR